MASLPLNGLVATLTRGLLLVMIWRSSCSPRSLVSARLRGDFYNFEIES
jgi:hypothetical protein